MQGVDFLHNKLYNDYINLNVQRGNIKMSNEILVFIDTNEYRRCGHNFKSTPMRKIHELASKNTIHLLSSTVVVGEVCKHIQDEVNEFSASQKKLAHYARSIRNLSDFDNMIKKFDLDETIERAKQAFNSFLCSCNCQVISSSNIDNDALLNDYFAKKLPFENNSKKGDEFKDAFIIHSLRKYADDTDSIIDVVSDDNGFSGALQNDERFRIYSRSEDLFAYITHIVEEIPAQNAKIVEEYINQPAINASIFSEIEDEIYRTGVWMDSNFDDVDIYSVQVNHVNLTYLDDIENDVLPFHLEVDVTLKIDYTCIDEGNSYWDKEEGCYLILRSSDCRLTKKVNLDFNGTLSVEVDTECKIKDIIEIDDFKIEETKFGIDIDLEEDDEIEILHSSLDDEYDEDAHTPGAYSTCPDCGHKINHENDGGNGFCLNCAPNH